MQTQTHATYIDPIFNDYIEGVDLLSVYNIDPIPT